MLVINAGVEFVGLEGPEKDQIAVIGDQVDSVCLASYLRKKVGHANIISVEEVKPKQEKKPTAENPV
ncbi:hypothetical protein BVC80_6973g3 [Macleaya cordata]|uniref:Uncharacterized protein n=1 Tax=Macleaya cordata TaxID=56857 RepID=A0A200QFT0_MACCD|nr:hypothetical protein BVC80_6973g3 [Macleaya cordata]